ncbi:MAG: TonB-dependent receptor, partial [Pseudomonadota bacterium]|nr:TonB-dependent receptor [Pseudomonadota bacterium]
EDYSYRGETQRFEYQGILDLTATDQITYGVEAEERSLASNIAGYPDAAGHNRVTGYYAQGQTTLFSELTLTGGIRYDDNQQFGGHTSLKFAGAWTPNDGATVLRANYGDGFKAPTLYELFSVYSNPLTALKPETAHGWEAGIDQALFGGTLRASLTYFNRHTGNQIDFFSCYFVTSAACALRSAVGGYYYNIGRSRAEGLEAEVHAKIGETLALSANLTDMHAVDLSSGTDLARRPHLMANAGAQWTPLADWSFGAGLNYVGRRFDSAGGYSPLPDYTLANLYASHKLDSHIELYARIENLFDHRYEPVAGYGAPGRAVYAGIRASY